MTYFADTSSKALAKTGDVEDDDWVTADIDVRACKQCGLNPWHLPHSICDQCIEEKYHRVRP